MADSKAAHHLFATISEKAQKSRAAYGTTKQYREFVAKELETVKSRFPDLTIKDYFHSRVVKTNKERSSALTAAPTASQFWRAAYEFNHLGNDSRPGSAGEYLLNRFATYESAY